MKRISITSSCYNEEGNHPEFHRRLTAVMAQFSQYDYEIIWSDNRSTDGSRDVIRRLCAEDRAHLKAIFNAANFGQIRSPYNAMMSASGDAVVTMCSDLQEPPELVADFIRAWEGGAKVVCGVKPRSRENPLMFLVRRCYYRLIKALSDTPQIENFTGFGLYDRRVIDALRSFHEPNPYIRGLVAAGVLTAVSPFIWPTAVVLFPLYVAHGFPLSGDKQASSRQEAPRIHSGDSRHRAASADARNPADRHPVRIHRNVLQLHRGASVSLAGVLTAFAKETLRAPFLMGLAALGFGLWARRRKFALLLAFSASLGACVITHCHTFRLIYLTPFFLLMAVDAADWLHARRPALAAVTLGLTVAYGIATGPVAYALVPGERLPQGLEQRLAAAVGSGPKAVFTPDYSTYYLGRRLGWRQLAYGNAGTYADREASARLLSRADAVVMAEADLYAAVEETHTLYGLLRDRALDAARRERDSASKSPLARIGSGFATPWRPEIQVGEPFREIFSDSGISVHARR